MELFDIVADLEEKITGLLEEVEALREEARNAEQLRVENRALHENLDEERALRGQIETRLSSILSLIDSQLDAGNAAAESGDGGQEQ
ncbi:MAG: hypothetical protein IKX79_05260 [Desulfovibrionaceae bacterium]|nr:hypothetical protein [Desulfovibrionaceae bacterium]MBO4793463.1 hypothetical protein [Deltaproteobacteria bacterium]MBR5734924.1 hypothetical protein [Desulfovibrionaceae bacterium]